MGGFSGLLIIIGSILLAGLAIDYLGARTHLPRVTLLLLFGLAIGPFGLGLLTDASREWFPLITDIALLVVGFLLGGQLAGTHLKRLGRLVVSISLVESTLTVLVVLAGLLVVGVNPEMALLLAGIATATAPAAILDVVHEIKARGVLTRTILGVVAIDDAWGLIVFAMMLTAAGFYMGERSVSLLMAGVWDIAGAVLVGIVLGIPSAFLTGRIRPGEPTLIEAVGITFLCGGLSLALGVSLILAAIIMGATIANFARHHTRPFHMIEYIEAPIMILFFVLAGASFHIDSLLQIGFVGVAYIVFRVLGKILGAWLGARASHAPDRVRNWTGVALMPQAGVAIGMALIASQRFPEPGAVILNVVIGATIIFELFGPLLTRLALVRAGEAELRAPKE